MVNLGNICCITIRQHHLIHTSSPDHPQTHDDLDELIHADHLNQHRRNQDSRASLYVAGLVMACAIALHNVPEGMTIGASFAAPDGALESTGMVMAVLIGLHNIPEGMAVAVPLLSGGMSRIRAILITAACALPTVLGAWLGYWLGDIGPLGLAVSLSLASGAMLYVVFGEILPQSVLMHRSKTPAFFVILGMLIGLMSIYYSAPTRPHPLGAGIQRADDVPGLQRLVHQGKVVLSGMVGNLHRVGLLHPGLPARHPAVGQHHGAT